jgi:GH25 family lysozyme M1 (1,4-beta-N-acetylmuramidase)
MGPHAILSSSAALTWTAVAPIAKALDNTQILRAAQPSAIKVFRHYFAAPNLDDAAGTANAIIAALNGYRDPNLYVEVWNESHPTVAQLSAVVTFLHAVGLKVAGGSWGTGDYTAADWEIPKQAGCDATAVHCYWGSQGFTIWEALRYHQFWQAGDLPVIISECGFGAVEGGASGWHPGGLSATQYTSELVSYAQTIAQDTYVLGATPFTSGPTTDWVNYEIDSITPQLMATLENSPVTTHPLPFLSGCDVSNLQKTIDWPTLSRCSQFAAIKASQGTTFTDPFYGANWYNAGQNGVPRIAYHYGMPSTTTGAEDAQHFVSVLAANGINSGDNFALDLEDPAVATGADLAAYAIDFAQTLQPTTHCVPWLYCGLSYAQEHNLLTAGVAAAFRLWLAAYQLTIPSPIGAWTTWTAWQWNDAGTLPGISGVVDLDFFQGTTAQLLAMGKP